MRTCFIRPGSEMAKGCASSLIVAGPRDSRSRMPRRVGSDSAANVRSSTEYFTIRLTLVRGARKVNPARSGGTDRQPVVEPLVLAGRADPVVDGLRAVVVAGGLPDQLGGAVLAAALQAGGDERLGHPTAARLGGHEQVVHHPDAGGGQRLPGPVQGGEADGTAGVVAGQQLQALPSRVGEQRLRQLE